jgi:hypothetical protein
MMAAKELLPVLLVMSLLGQAAVQAFVMANVDFLEAANPRKLLESTPWPAPILTIGKLRNFEKDVESED